MGNSELRELLAKWDFLAKADMGKFVPIERDDLRRLLADSEAYAKAMNEISCCDDVVLSNGLTAAIADLREQRDSMWRDLAKLRAEIAGLAEKYATRAKNWISQRSEYAAGNAKQAEDAEDDLRALLRLPAGEPGEAA